MQACHEAAAKLVESHNFLSVLEAPDIAECHCRIENCDGVVTLHPGAGECFVNGDLVTQPTRLTQGGLVRFGAAVVVRFNHPQEALRMREERRVGIQLVELVCTQCCRRSCRWVSLTQPCTSSALTEPLEYIHACMHLLYCACCVVAEVHLEIMEVSV